MTPKREESNERQEKSLGDQKRKYNILIIRE